MKFTLVITNDPIIYLPILDRLFRNANQRIDTLIVVPGIDSLKIGKKYIKIVSRLYGPVYMISLLFRYLTGPAWSFKKLAKKHGFHLAYAPGVNNEEFYQILHQRQSKSVFSMTPEIYRKKTLSIDGIKFYNLHGSILPGNKGILPFFWTCLYDEVPGITVHEIDEKIDTGKIIYQEKLTDSTNNTIQSLSDILADNCDRYLLNAMDHVEKNIPPVLLNHGVENSYRPMPEDPDIAAYKKKMKL